jgi:hypothetical protein
MLRADHEDEKHDGGEPETHKRELTAAWQTHRVGERAGDVLNAQVRHRDPDGKPSVSEPHESTANSVVDCGHTGDDHAEAGDADHSVPKAPSRGCTHVDSRVQPIFHGSSQAAWRTGPFVFNGLRRQV